MNPIFLGAAAVGGYLLLSGKAEALGTDWSTAPIDQLSAMFAGKKIKDVPAIALQRLHAWAADRVNAGPQAPGIYGEKLLTPVPGQNAGDGQPIYFFRWSAKERLRDMAALIDGNRWSDPNGTLYLVAIKGQPKYGFFDKFAGEIKSAAGAIGGGAVGFVTGGPAGAVAGAKAGSTLVGKL